MINVMFHYMKLEQKNQELTEPMEKIAFMFVVVAVVADYVVKTKNMYN